ncbi:hypothetical protein HRM2_07750 [Desulforapulum autotrophicum HRM2]|uniref:Uncharacterized protein n=1 Tax=Desulforapulum autotrophicum (strain ATCC 43914 / DSM 3382 / VKM B-1955 / HRM2) TaxID=177437 RepID=C0QJN6_DESAH|nr:hypothetical protein HRM2_07750 [Desulforapulum autotrophicum HRM2]
MPRSVAMKLSALFTSCKKISHSFSRDQPVDGQGQADRPSVCRGPWRCFLPEFCGHVSTDYKGIGALGVRILEIGTTLADIPRWGT